MMFLSDETRQLSVVNFRFRLRRSSDAR